MRPGGLGDAQLLAQAVLAVSANPALKMMAAGTPRRPALVTVPSAACAGAMM